MRTNIIVGIIMLRDGINNVVVIVRMFKNITKQSLESIDFVRENGNIQTIACTFMHI